MLLVCYKLVGTMTLVLDLSNVGKSIFLLVLVNKLESNLEVKEYIILKLHKKSSCTQNQSFSSWIINWGKVFRCGQKCFSQDWPSNWKCYDVTNTRSILIQIDSRSYVVFVFICDQKHHPKVIWKENTYHAIFDKIIVINNLDIKTFHNVLCFLANFCNCDFDVLGLIDD